MRDWPFHIQKFKTRFVKVTNAAKSLRPSAASDAAVAVAPFAVAAKCGQSSVADLASHQMYLESMVCNGKHYPAVACSSGCSKQQAADASIGQRASDSKLQAERSIVVAKSANHTKVQT
mmetsp:Transcript_42068/g.83208  ORF Transcript_42068/g.83208 Transcript_42068/m.83208 type:complete len:119 (-) Transcript_42068:109-465(-)